MSDKAFTIPFNNITYLCWQDKDNTPQYRPLSREEDYKYFTAKDQGRVMSELIGAVPKPV